MCRYLCRLRDTFAKTRRRARYFNRGSRRSGSSIHGGAAIVLKAHSAFKSALIAPSVRTRLRCPLNEWLGKCDCIIGDTIIPRGRMECFNVVGSSSRRSDNTANPRDLSIIRGTRCIFIGPRHELFRRDNSNEREHYASIVSNRGLPIIVVIVSVNKRGSRVSRTSLASFEPSSKKCARRSSVPASLGPPFCDISEPSPSSDINVRSVPRHARYRFPRLGGCTRAICSFYLQFSFARMGTWRYRDRDLARCAPVVSCFFPPTPPPPL